MDNSDLALLLVAITICIAVIAGTRYSAGGNVIAVIMGLATALYVILFLLPRADPRDCARVLEDGIGQSETYWKKQCLLHAAKHGKSYFAGKWGKMKLLLRANRRNTWEQWFRVCCTRLRAERIARRHLGMHTGKHEVVMEVLRQLGQSDNLETTTSVAIRAGCNDAVRANEALGAL